jgi:AICAR transformylase/IMP cyclohydrolase PurH
MIDIGGPRCCARARRTSRTSPQSPARRSTAQSSRSCARGRAALGDPPAARRRGVRATAAYEAPIAAWFADARRLPRAADAPVREGADLATARTRTSARPTTQELGRGATCSRSSSSCTASELSFNNLHDLDAAARLVDEFTLPAA